MNVLVSVYRMKAESPTALNSFIAETPIAYFNKSQIVSGRGYSKEEAIENLKKNILEWKYVEFHSVDISDILNFQQVSEILEK